MVEFEIYRAALAATKTDPFDFLVNRAPVNLPIMQLIRLDPCNWRAKVGAIPNFKTNSPWRSHV